ncbi:hypothetical protein FSB78_10060 [Sphingomonas ginsenosidivorax]|uniref:Uncharacterized protein n=1 Tax=Sphingomonas ginsenosidivorax TaxID=862135 RepID=A0A5C6UER1_9SPHN|nr:hypothetical protein FSB78_10060 [Sphingomonas ginsenosidivorax]
MRTLITVALLLAPGVAAAQAIEPVAAPPATSTQPAVKAKPPKPLCRKEDVTGSFFPARTCHTKEEWAAIDAANAQNAERMSATRNSGSRR